MDFLLTGNDGQKILTNSINYPDSAKEWLDTKKPIMLSDGYSSLIFDEYTHMIFLNKDSSQPSIYKLQKNSSLRNSIRNDLKEAKV